MNRARSTVTLVVLLLSWLCSGLTPVLAAEPEFNEACFNDCMGMMYMAPDYLPSDASLKCDGFATSLKFVVADYKERLRALLNKIPPTATYNVIHFLCATDDPPISSTNLLPVTVENQVTSSNNSSVPVAVVEVLQLEPISISLSKATVTATIATPISHRRALGLLGSDGELFDLRLNTTIACAKQCGSPIRYLRALPSALSAVIEANMFTMATREVIQEFKQLDLDDRFLELEPYVWNMSLGAPLPSRCDNLPLHCNPRQGELVSLLQLNSTCRLLHGQYFSGTCEVPKSLHSFIKFISFLAIAFALVILVIIVSLALWVMCNQRFQKSQSTTTAQLIDHVRYLMTNSTEYAEFNAWADDNNQDLETLLSGLMIPNIHHRSWTRAKLLELFNWDRVVFQLFSSGRGTRKIIESGVENWLCELSSFVIGVLPERQKKLEDFVLQSSDHRIVKVQPTLRDVIEFSHFAWECISSIESQGAVLVKGFGPREVLLEHDIQSANAVNVLLKGPWQSVHHMISRLFFVINRSFVSRPQIHFFLNGGRSDPLLRKIFIIWILVCGFGIGIACLFWFTPPSNHAADVGTFRFLSSLWICAIIPFALRVVIHAVFWTSLSLNRWLTHATLFIHPTTLRLRRKVLVVVEIPIWIGCGGLVVAMVMWTMIRIVTVNPITVGVAFLSFASIIYVGQIILHTTERRLQVILDVLNDSAFMREGFEQCWPPWECVAVPAGAWRDEQSLLAFLGPQADIVSAVQRESHKDDSISPQPLEDCRFFIGQPQRYRVDSSNFVVRSISIYEFSVQFSWDPTMENDHSVVLGWCNGIRMIGLICSRGELSFRSWDCRSFEESGIDPMIASRYLGEETLPVLRTGYCENMTIFLRLEIFAQRPPEVCVVFPQEVVDMSPHVKSVGRMTSPLLSRVAALTETSEPRFEDANKVISPKLSFGKIGAEYSPISAWALKKKSSSSSSASSSSTPAFSSGSTFLPPGYSARVPCRGDSGGTGVPTTPINVRAAAGDPLVKKSGLKVEACSPSSIAVRRNAATRTQSMGEASISGLPAIPPLTQCASMDSVRGSSMSNISRAESAQPKQGLQELPFLLMDFSTCVVPMSPKMKGVMAKRARVARSVLETAPPARRATESEKTLLSLSSTASEAIKGAMYADGVAVRVNSGPDRLFSLHFLFQILQRATATGKLSLLLGIVEIGYAIFVVGIIVSLQRSFSPGGTAEIQRSLIPVLASLLAAAIHKYSTQHMFNRNKIRSIAHQLVRYRIAQAHREVAKYFSGASIEERRKARYFNALMLVTSLCMIALVMSVAPQIVSSVIGANIEYPDVSWIWYNIPP